MMKLDACLEWWMPRNGYNEQSKVYDKRYREKNKEKIALANKLYRENNKFKIKEARKKWLAKNPYIGRIYIARRKARLRGAKVEKYTTEQVLNTYGTDCYLCGKPINLSAPRRVGKEGWQDSLHIDHVVPLSKGGDDVLSNVRPSHGLCNMKKYTRRLFGVASE